MNRTESKAIFNNWITQSLAFIVYVHPTACVSVIEAFSRYESVDMLTIISWRGRRQNNTRAWSQATQLSAAPRREGPTVCSNTPDTWCCYHHQSNGCNSSEGLGLLWPFGYKSYSRTCCCCCCWSTSKFKFSVCAKEVWIKALLIPGKQMRTVCLMLMPS